MGLGASKLHIDRTFAKVNLQTHFLAIKTLKIEQNMTNINRLNHASVLVGRKMVVHGGWDGKRKSLNDLWVFDTDSFTWLNPITAGLSPCPRYGNHF
jgi:hypothetical protein